MKSTRISIRHLEPKARAKARRSKATSKGSRSKKKAQISPLLAGVEQKIHQEMEACLAQGRLVLTSHARERLVEREFTIAEVREAATAARLVGARGSSAKFRGRTPSGREVTLVCAYKALDEKAQVITLY